MKLSNIFDILFAICSHDIEQVINIFPYVIKCYEKGQFIILNKGNSYQVLFYCFTTEKEAMQLAEDDSLLYKCFSDCDNKGEVLVVIFAGGKIDNDGIAIFKRLLDKYDVKGILFHKRKTKKTYYVKRR
ncbi:MAG: hypothetical protein QXV73_04090 [Candidatus Micrarchaeia archaeon]